MCSRLQMLNCQWNKQVVAVCVERSQSVEYSINSVPLSHSSVFAPESTGQVQDCGE